MNSGGTPVRGEEAITSRSGIAERNPRWPNIQGWVEGGTIEELLARFSNFDECVIEQVTLSHFQTEIRILIDYIWGTSGSIRPDLDARPEVVALWFRRVQEVRFKNGLNEAMLAEPASLNWGMNEVAAIEILDDPAVLAPYSGALIQFRHAGLLWHSARDPLARRIDMVYGDFELRWRDFVARFDAPWNRDGVVAAPGI